MIESHSTCVITPVEFDWNGGTRRSTCWFFADPPGFRIEEAPALMGDT
jgi:hypothetical protein